ncbi:unnamed protein product, partial [Symbiodinium pilosum]
LKIALGCAGAAVLCLGWLTAALSIPRKDEMDPYDFNNRVVNLLERDWSDC